MSPELAAQNMKGKSKRRCPTAPPTRHPFINNDKRIPPQMYSTLFARAAQYTKPNHATNQPTHQGATVKEVA